MMSFATFAAFITSRRTPREYGVTSEDFAFGPKTISFSVSMAGSISEWGVGSRGWGVGARDLGLVVALSVVGFPPTPHPRPPPPLTPLLPAVFFVLYYV